MRTGNAAAEQHLLDVYGELLRAAALQYESSSQPPSTEAWALLHKLVERAAEHWNDVGSGIWEVRGDPQPFLYGKLMCWAALDCGVRLAHNFQLDADVQRWLYPRPDSRRHSGEGLQPPG